MSNKPSAPKVNSRVIWLAIGEFELIDDAVCPQCGDALHAEDAEELANGVRLICRRGHLFLRWEAGR